MTEEAWYCYHASSVIWDIAKIAITDSFMYLCKSV